MSFEIGQITGSHVYITDPDSDSRGGFEVDTLEETLAIIEKGDDGFRELSDVFKTMLSNPGLHGEIIRQREARQQYLFAAIPSYDDNPYGPRPLGLLYAEGAGKMNVKTLAAIKLGTWVNVDAATEYRISPDEIKETLGSFCLKTPKEEDKFFWGVPVDRATKLIDVRSGDEQTFGYRQDRKVIKALPEDMPESLRHRLTVTVDAYHNGS